MKYRLSTEAVAEIVAIYHESASAFGLAQADQYHLGLERAFEYLAANPRAVRERKELFPPVRAYPYHAHVVLYVVEDDGSVSILNVRHAREDWARSYD